MPCSFPPPTGIAQWASGAQFWSGVGSLPAVTRGQLVNAERLFADRYRVFVDDVQGGNVVYKLMPQHPLWNKDNGVLLPAVFNTKIELSKSRGSNLLEHNTTRQAGAAGAAVFQSTIESIRLFAKRVVTTEGGMRTYRSMLNSVGRLTVPVIRNVVTTHQLQTGATNISLSQQGRRPRAIAIWCILSANRQLTGNPAWLPPDTMPLQAQRGNIDNQLNAANHVPCRFKSLRIWGTDFPQKYEISCDTLNEASGASGGTQLRDCRMYKELF